VSQGRRAIVVFGCPVGEGGVASPALERRLIRAREEAERDPQALLVVSGGIVRGEREAPFMREWLVARGVEAARLRLESTARDTEENAAFVAELLRQESVTTVTLVTDAFHMRRSRWLLMLAMRRVTSLPSTVVGLPARDDKRRLERVALAVGETWKLLWSLCQMLWRRHLRPSRTSRVPREP
jgi:uncharacterized SAM-binding protein YcdF (DUF218 family)